jgi:hypothetical protein
VSLPAAAANCVEPGGVGVEWRCKTGNVSTSRGLALEQISAGILLLCELHPLALRFHQAWLTQQRKRRIDTSPTRTQMQGQFLWVPVGGDGGLGLKGPNPSRPLARRLEARAPAQCRRGPRTPHTPRASLGGSPSPPGVNTTCTTLMSQPQLHRTVSDNITVREW